MTKAFRLNDEASAGYIAYFGVCLVFGIFLFVALGPLFDILISVINSGAVASTIPVSQTSMNTANTFIIIIRSIRFIVILLPLIVYGIIVAYRERNDVVW